MSRWLPPEGEPIDTFAILTCEANDVMRRIHDRMPVILPEEAIDPWLDPAVTDLDVVTALLRPAAQEAIVTREVSTWVNSPAHDDERCIEPVTAP